MESPLIQTEAQANKLKKLLNANCKHLSGTILGLQRRFGGYKYDTRQARSFTLMLPKKVTPIVATHMAP